MKFSFSVRNCLLPETRWSYLLKYIPLSSSAPVGVFCSKTPFGQQKYNTFLRTSSLLLLIHSFITLVALLFSRPTPKRDVQDFELSWKRQYALIIWQLFSVMMQVHIHNTISIVRNEAEPLFLSLLRIALTWVDLCCWIVVSGSLKEVSQNMFKSVIAVQHFLAWTILVAGLFC